jgi:hypothetical protein
MPPWPSVSCNTDSAGTELRTTLRTLSCVVSAPATVTPPPYTWWPSSFKFSSVGTKGFARCPVPVPKPSQRDLGLIFRLNCRSAYAGRYQKWCMYRSLFPSRGPMVLRCRRGRMKQHCSPFLCSIAAQQTSILISGRRSRVPFSLHGSLTMDRFMVNTCCAQRLL